MIFNKEMYPLKVEERLEISKMACAAQLPMFYHRYNCALKTISVVIQSMDEEYNIKAKHNPIHNIDARIKSLSSIFRKLETSGLALTLENAESRLTDIAGIRVVCKYIDDVYMLADKLLQYYEGSVLKICDYIAKPKANGYRSYHIVLKVAVHIDGQTYQIPVEIQLRTIAMDMWASLEHELRYKKDIECDTVTREKLRICSLTMQLVDQSMQEIFHEIRQENSQCEQSANNA